MDAKYASWAEMTKGLSLEDKKSEGSLYGEESEQKELDTWLDQFKRDLLPLIQSNDKKLTATLHKTNKALLSSTFLVSNHITLADLVLYVNLHSMVASWGDKEKLMFENITRWFDHVQHLISREGSSFKLVEINPYSQPFEPRKKKEAEKKQQQQKKEGGADNKKAGLKQAPATAITEPQDKRDETAEREKKLEEQGVQTTATSSITPVSPVQPVMATAEGEGKGKGKQQQEKKPQEGGKGKQQQEKKPQEGGKGGKGKGGGNAKEPAPQLSATEDVSRLDIRVGLIKTCRNHENADSLYIEEIDVGEENPRQVVSGLVKFVPLDQMQNRRVLLLCNLKPANLKGVRSQAMVLAASNEEHTQVELVDPPAEAKIGERVAFAGYSGDPEKALKKETLDIVLPLLRANEEKVATYKGVPFMTSAGPCTVKTIANGGIR